MEEKIQKSALLDEFRSLEISLHCGLLSESERISARLKLKRLRKKINLYKLLEGPTVLQNYNTSTALSMNND
ncbi:MAG: hypothetical protein RIS47_1179 [Bacteroidota bacterium]